ncbi:SDR family NAD(P)-dependent oxidoreductase [Mesorhizobium sp. LHD-90]|uniref:SDR family NAD(P)-dependent oxidoreductase n=1 Tax=Mesorhizobium sp. LHD-90 TaxID=3071414 RepID=UPI0027DF7214|nr:SDR family NAD(P)-dependent oxidoreductase [Mesorhizobium sp. LHD-90]MDQ6433252.1 SDR family NAD(P)-dependent oxidoreductase [Mesorhizobium sp. LHD-90]
MPFDLNAGLKGKHVLLTGAAGGIGREVALAFAGAGASVAAVDIDQQRADAVVAEMEGGPHLAIGYDLKPVVGHAPLVERVVKAFGRLDVLVQTAAVLVRRPTIFDVSEADWDFQHDVNLKASFFLAQAAARQMAERGEGGRIINFTSQGFWSGGFGGSVAYAATKGGIVSMTRGMARSLAKQKITVNAVSPGAADTAMMRSGMDEAALAGVTAQIPLGYMAHPSELAGAVLFLASDHAGYITGATINVSGGWLMY